MKTAYVTGADRGLGHGLTQVLLEQGYRVYAGQYMPGWEQLSALKEEYGGRLTLLPLDISDPGQVAAAAGVIAGNEASLDLLCNVAGIAGKAGRGSVFDEFSESDYEGMHRLYDVNTLGPLRVTRSVIDLIVRGEGKTIITISSEAGSVGGNWRNGEYGYCMSKAALNMQSAILQHSLLHLGVKVLCLHPGWLRSYMSGKLNEQATEEPLEVAYKIAGLLGDKRLMDLASPMYMDYRGMPLSY
ncbi:MAG: SDR family NAD(P)-dependent oxidoreductase [Oscillospiraceae bacterium]|jgi:NAD(P)-dependent dehydrogenase (short-subunit alcohol dehydrogenase family)|nr:SDR family NAD(P)-dependent oxidoreductase [Oscillospiraceae bacterium]